MAFRTKIPTEYHKDIMNWRIAGITAEGIIVKLVNDHNFHTNPRTLSRLIKHLDDEKQAITKTVITNQVQEQIISDLDALNKLCSNLVELANLTYRSDNNLYLRTVDRLSKILAMKLGMSSKDNSRSERAEEEVLEGLLAKLGK